MLLCKEWLYLSPGVVLLLCIQHRPMAAAVAAVVLVPGTQTHTGCSEWRWPSLGSWTTHTHTVPCILAPPLALDPAAFSECTAVRFSSSSGICLAVHFSPPPIWIVFPELPFFFAVQRLSKASPAQMGRNYRNLYYPGIHFHQRVTLCRPVSTLLVVAKS